MYFCSIEEIDHMKHVLKPLEKGEKYGSDGSEKT
jgi:hypothetical protein